MAEQYPWYGVADEEQNVAQGDFIKQCPIIVPTSQVSDNIEANVRTYNVIVMSQSCDLEQEKLDLVLVCPFWPLREIGESNHFLKSSQGKESLRRGHLPAYHLLNKCEMEGFEANDFLVVDFRNVFGVQFEFLKDFIGKTSKRLRLLSPYREHLSQAFARFFMRVGLPIDIPPFKKQKQQP